MKVIITKLGDGYLIEGDLSKEGHLMFGTLKSLAKAALNVAVIPVELAKDACSYTQTRLEKIDEHLEDALD
jgi:hypothetical protein